MKKSIYKYMKVGFVHFMAFPTTIKGDGPIAETVRKIVLDVTLMLLKLPGYMMPMNVNK